MKDVAKEVLDRMLDRGCYIGPIYVSKGIK